MYHAKLGLQDKDSIIKGLILVLDEKICNLLYLPQSLQLIRYELDLQFWTGATRVQPTICKKIVFISNALNKVTD